MALKLMLFGALAIASRSKPVAFGLPRTKPQPLVTASLDDIVLDAAPIEPSWVIAGAPQARAGLKMRGHDNQSTTAVWDCTAGTFRWYFGWDETVFILEGEVQVIAEDGSERTLRAGDIGYFAAKTWATWHVDSYVKKVAFCRKPFPGPLALAYRLRERLRRSKKAPGFAG